LVNDGQSQHGRGAFLAVAPGGAVVGAICAVALTTYAGARVGSPLVLRFLFAVWVFSPFAAILTGYAFSASWRRTLRSALHAITLVIAAGSSLAYAYCALGTARPATAAFVLIPPASVLFAAVALGITAFSAKE
jgi:phosphate/sulfate permease